MRAWFQQLTADAQEAAAHDREQFVKWSGIRHSTLGMNFMEQDLAYIISTVLEASI